MLLEGSVDSAHEEGMRRFTAVLLTRNLAMLHLFEHVGAARVASRYGDTLELEVELPFETGAPMEAIRAARRRGARERSRRRTRSPGNRSGRAR